MSYIMRTHTDSDFKHIHVCHHWQYWIYKLDVINVGILEGRYRLYINLSILLYSVSDIGDPVGPLMYSYSGDIKITNLMPTM